MNSCSRKNKGFTLIELVIALSLSVIILLILFAGMRLGYRSQEKGNERAELSQRTRILGDRITWLIRGAYPYFVTKADEHKLYFDGKSDMLGFVTTSVDPYGKGPEDMAGLKWISIFIDSEGLKIREKVFFLEDVFDDSGGNVVVFDHSVRKIAFKYFDVSEDDKQGTWVSDWDYKDKDYMPSAVKYTITFEYKGKKITMPEQIVRINAQLLKG